jgi:arylsulfatase A-like enzyme
MSLRGLRFARGSRLARLVAPALLALAACGPPPAGKPAPASLPELVRLWRPPTALPVSVVPSSVPAAAAQPLWHTSFDGTDGCTWYAVVGAPDKELQYKTVKLSFGPVPVQHATGLAATTSFPVTGGQAVTVKAVVRTRGGPPDGVEEPVVGVFELREPFDPGVRLSAQDVADFVDPRRHSKHLLDMTPSEAARTLETSFVTDRATIALQILLVAPPQQERTLIVEHVDVQTQPIDVHLAHGGSFPGLDRLGDPALPSVQITLDRDRREGLLARPGERVAFTLPPCAQAQRLELSTGVAPRDGALQDAVRLSLLLQPAGGAPQTLLERRRAAPVKEDDAAWVDEPALELPPLPQGGTLSFACEAEGADPPLAVWGHPTLSRSRAAPPPNVVLISIDTLRPDHLGCYGGDPALAPHIDGLAAQGLRFAHAYSTSAYTLPSHGSLLTGQWPALHGAVDNGDRLDPQRSPFLARLLAEAGWTTAAFTGGGYVSPECGFTPGFDRYSSNDPVWALDSDRGQAKLRSMSWERVPQETALLRRYAEPSIEDWIARRAGGPPFFVFLHTYIVHNYAPDLAALGKHGLLGPHGEQQPFNHQEMNAFNAGKLSGDEARDRIRGQYIPYYDATIDMADAFVGRVLDALERAGLREGTLVVLVADHGEEFGERGFFGHGETLNEAAVRVPLIARLPAGAAGPPPGSVSEPLVSLADVAPWILRLCGRQPDPRMQTSGSLAPSTTSPPGRDRLWIELDTHINRISALREGPFKLQLALDGATRGIEPGQVQLFDLAADPGQTADLAGERAADAARLRAELDGFHDYAERIHPRRTSPAEAEGYSEEARKQLEGMGYFGAAKSTPEKRKP